MHLRQLRFLLLGSASLLILTASSCSALQQMVRTSQDPTLNRLMDDVPLSAALKEKIAMYRKYSAKFMQFHDSGTLAENDILDVLKDTGVIQGKPGVQPPKQVRPPVQAYTG